MRRVLIGSLIALSATAAAPARVRIATPDADASPPVTEVAVEDLDPVVVAGLAGFERQALADAIDGARAATVRLVDGEIEMPPVLGSWQLEGARLRFEPRFPLGAKLEFRVEIDGAALDRLAGVAAGTTPSLGRTWATAPNDSGVHADAPRVVAHHPSAAEVPANLLRIYLHFSTSMRERDVASFVRLEDEAGAPIDTPFVYIPDGLWDPAARRLTLFIHPGRVKRGVGPRTVLGPVLEPGHVYRLVVDRALRDAAGRPSEADYTFEFRTTEADRASPRPETWTVTPPAGRGEALVVDLGEPLDHALLERLLTVRDSAGHPVPGRVRIGDGGRRWRFEPATLWTPGRYRLDVDPAIEDLAGNRPGRLFDADQPALAAAEGAREVIGLPFRVLE